MSMIPSDYISFTSMYGSSLCVVNDTDDASTSLFSILEREVYPHFLSRLSDNTNDWVIKKATEFQELDPLFCPLTYTNSEVKFNTLFFPTDASRYAYFIGIMKGDISSEWYKVKFSTNVLHKQKYLDVDLSFFKASYQRDGKLQTYSSVLLWMYPVTTIPISNAGDGFISGEQINIVLFVDWRYFIRDAYYKSDMLRMFSSTDSVTDRNIITEDINAIISNIRGCNFPTSFYPNEYSELESDGTYCLDSFASVTKAVTTEITSRLKAAEERNKIPFRLRSLENCPLPLAIDTILAFYGLKLYCPKSRSASYNVEVSVPIVTQQTKLRYDERIANPSLNNPYKVRVFWPVATSQDNFYINVNTNADTDLQITSAIKNNLAYRANELLKLPTEVRLCLNSIPEIQCCGTAYGLFSDIYEAKRQLNGYYFHSCLTCFGYGEKREHAYIVCERTELGYNRWEYHGSYVEHKAEQEEYYGCPADWYLTQTDTGLLNTVEINNGGVGRMGNGTFVGGEPNTGLDIETADNYGAYVTYDRDEILPIGAGSIHRVYEDGGLVYFAAENAILNKAGIRLGTLVRAYDGVGYPKVYSDGVTYRLEPFTPESAIEAGTEILFARDVDTQKLRAIIAAATGGGTVCYFDNDTSLHRTYETEDTGDYPPTDSEGGTSSGGSGDSSGGGSSSSGESGSEGSGSSGGESTPSDSGGGSPTEGGEGSGEGTGEGSGGDSGGDGGGGSGDDNGDDPFTNEDDPGLPTDYIDDGTNP